MTKRARQLAIREIITTASVTSQENLRRRLRRQGFDVTQATLSRDLKELGVGWVASNGGGHYALQPGSNAGLLRPLAGAEVVSIQANEGLIVIRTLPGCANTVGEFIDVQNHPDVIGTVAGDNTLLIVPRSVKKTAQVLHFFKRKLMEE